MKMKIQVAVILGGATESTLTEQYIYDNGSECSSVTGGYYRGTGVTFNADSFQVVNNTGSGSRLTYTLNSIDLTNAKSIEVYAHAINQGGYANPGKILVTPAQSAANPAASVIIDAAGTNDSFKVYTLDVSSLSGSYYITFAVDTYSSIVVQYAKIIYKQS